MSPSKLSASFKQTKMNGFPFFKTALLQLLLSMTLLAILPTPIFSTQSERQIKIPALNQTLNLSDVYDEKSDEVNETECVLEQKMECLVNPCLNGEKCFYKSIKPYFQCSGGLNDTNYKTVINHCAEFNECFNLGTCVNGVNTFTCICREGFTGNRCEVDIDDCAGHSRCLNGGTCVDARNGFICVCAEDFAGQHCEHQDNQCLHPGTCAYVGKSGKCKCGEGSASNPQDTRKCKLENENATLLFGSWGSDRGIQEFSLSQGTVTRIQNHSHMGYALDVMHHTNTMFWSDESGNIYTAPIRQGAAKTVVLNDRGSRTISLAVDWVYGHLYFADNNRNTISVSNLDGGMKKVLFNTGVRNTRAIIVDPLSGWIYWADLDAKYIERAAMDGSQRQVIANTEPELPSGLTLDITQNRLYWTTLDSPASIHSMNVDGSDKKLVYQAAPPTFSLGQFGSITTFRDRVYWRELHTKAVYRTSKCGGEEATAVHVVDKIIDAVFTLQVYHVSKQPEGVNFCENRIGGQCSHLCFRIPSKGNQSVATTCACPDGRSLSSDQRTCT